MPPAAPPAGRRRTTPRGTGARCAAGDLSPYLTEQTRRSLYGDVASYGSRVRQGPLMIQPPASPQQSGRRTSDVVPPRLSCRPLWAACRTAAAVQHADGPAAGGQEAPDHRAGADALLDQHESRERRHTDALHGVIRTRPSYKRSGRAVGLGFPGGDLPPGHIPGHTGMAAGDRWIMAVLHSLSIDRPDQVGIRENSQEIATADQYRTAGRRPAPGESRPGGSGHYPHSSSVGRQRPEGIIHHAGDQHHDPARLRLPAATRPAGQPIPKGRPS